VVSCARAAIGVMQVHSGGGSVVCRVSCCATDVRCKLTMIGASWASCITKVPSWLVTRTMINCSGS
jgi:hypothetical protein